MKQNAAPLNIGQRAIVNTLSFSPDATLAWNEVRTVHMRGSMQPKAMLASMRDLVEHHDALTSYIRDNVMGSGSADSKAVQSIDCRHLSRAKREEALAQALHSLVADPFDLERGPLFRAVLISLQNDEHVIGSKNWQRATSPTHKATQLEASLFLPRVFWSLRANKRQIHMPVSARPT
jgi:hypothetical protein